MNEEVETQEAPASDLPPAEERDFVVAEDLQSEPERPEWLPEKYKTGEDLAKAYKELESKLGRSEEELRASFIEELNKEAYADRPETAGDYQLPEFMDDDAVDNDLLKWWADHSFENGFSQDEFSAGLEKVFEAVQANVPDMEAEYEKLGDTAEARIEAAALFAQNFFPEKHMESIERLTETAGGLEALEFIMEQMKSTPVNPQSSPVDQITQESLEAMMRDERYWHPARKDMSYVKQVQDGFSKLYRS